MKSKDYISHPGWPNYAIRWGGYGIFILLLFTLFDYLSGVILFGSNNSISNYPLPPYGAIITEKQRRVFERLGDDDATKYIVYDQYLGWTVAPKRNSKNNLYRSNLYGIRSEENCSLKTPEGFLRIAAFGDSYTECIDVRNEQGWPYLVQENFDGVEVLNFGVRAYGTDQALLRYRKDGKQFKPDVVIIGYMLENMRRNVNRYRPVYEHNTGGIGVKPRFIIEDDELVLIPNPIRSAQELKKLIQENRLFEKVGEHDYWMDRYALAFDRSWFWWKSNFAKILWLINEKYERNLKRLYQDVDGEPFKVTAKLLNTFYHESLNDGAQYALVVILPAKNHLEEYSKSGKKFWQPLLDYLEKNGVEYIDTTPDLAEAHLKEPVVYGHYTPKGNAIVSAVLSRWLHKIISSS